MPYKADIRTLTTVAWYFIVAIIPWFLWGRLSPLSVAAFVVANGFLAFICAVIVHNTVGAHHMRPALHWSLLPEFHRTELKPFIHPNLDRTSLLPYLWQTHIYPGKRVCLGRSLLIPPKN